MRGLKLLLLEDSSGCAASCCHDRPARWSLCCTSQHHARCPAVMQTVRPSWGCRPGTVHHSTAEPQPAVRPCARSVEHFGALGHGRAQASSSRESGGCSRDTLLWLLWLYFLYTVLRAAAAALCTCIPMSAIVTTCSWHTHGAADNTQGDCEIQDTPQCCAVPSYIAALPGGISCPSMHDSSPDRSLSVIDWRRKWVDVECSIRPCASSRHSRSILSMLIFPE